MRLHRLVFLAAVAAGTVTPAMAARTATGIEIDGDYTDGPAPGEDWHPGHPPSADPVGSADGSLCDGTSPAPKNDIAQYFLAHDDDFLYVGLERLTNNGNTSFFLRFDVTGDGPSVGDFIFVFCFGSGAVVTDSYVLEWDPVAGDWAVDSTPPEVLFAVNLTRIPAPFGTLDEHGRPESSIDEGRFAEARIRLSDIEGFDPCLADAVTGVIESKSSCSLNSECKDTTGPFTFSFDPLAVTLAAAQEPSCLPSIIATATVSDPAGAVSYRWFLDGEDITDRDPSWSTSASITIGLTDECGDHVVSVEVNDGECDAAAEAPVDVNRRPIATIASLAVGACDRVLTYDGRASEDCNGSDIAYRWDFDADGVIDSTTATGTFTYPGCGDHLVVLTVNDGSCDSDPVGAEVSVNEAPVAVLTVTPTGCLVVETSSAATDCDLSRPPDSGTEELTQVLDFGDGSPPSDGSPGSHEYEGCGTYILTLTVTDASGCVDAATRSVTFSPVLDVR